MFYNWTILFTFNEITVVFGFQSIVLLFAFYMACLLSYSMFLFLSFITFFFLKEILKISRPGQAGPCSGPHISGISVVSSGLLDHLGWQCHLGRAAQVETSWVLAPFQPFGSLFLPSTWCVPSIWHPPNSEICSCNVSLRPIVMGGQPGKQIAPAG